MDGGEPMEGIMNKFDTLLKILALSAVVLFINGMSLQVLAQTDKGIELYNSWEYEKAEKAFRKVLMQEPNDAQAGYYLGLSLLMQGKYKEALDILQNVKASEEAGLLNKGQLEISLTRAYLGLERYPEALECLKAAERAKANPVDIHTFRGAYYLKEVGVDEAAKELEKAIALGSQNAYTYYYAGFAYLRLGNPAKAVQMFQEFLRLSPYAPEAANAKFLVDSLC
jgi:tetratricopeptide (TPR) repeat protein